MSIPVISSRSIPTQRTIARCFATYNNLRAELKPLYSSGSSSSSKGKEVDESRTALYQNSKAALRPRANAKSPLYASTSIQKRHTDGRGSDKSSNTATRDDRSADASYVAALNSPEARSSDRLRQLYARLDKTPDPKDAFSCVAICRLIKQELEKLSSPGSTISPPIYVYEVLLKRLSMAGAYDLCGKVLQDMRTVGYNVGIAERNFMLQAAVQDGNETLVEDALQEIASIGGGLDFKGSSSNQQPTILSEQTTRNWTATTYQHLIRRCHLTHNPDYMLLLLGSASHRQKQGGDELAFLSNVLNHSTVVDIIMLLCHVREARLVVEIGEWFHGGVAARKLTVQSWMTILRCCADQAYLPGIKIAWERTVVQGLLTPDDGIVIGILNAAAREGDTAFIQRIQEYHKFRLAQANLSLQEWHLTPLYESHCVNHDYFRAIQSIVDISRITHTNFNTNSLASLRNEASSSSEELHAAYDDFLAVGRDPSPKGGVSVVILNTLLAAANRLGLSAMALKLYRSRKLVRNESSPPDTPLPTLPKSPFDEDPADEASRQDDATSHASAYTAAEGENVEQHTLRADLETYNQVLYAAVQLRNSQVGQIFLRHLNAAKIKADERTYELAIRLELTKTDYQDAFRLLEECKKRKMVPNRWSYLFIGKRCLTENDPRWVMIAREMLENEYSLGGELFWAMQDAGHISPDEAREYSARFEQLGHGTVRSD